MSAAGAWSLLRRHLQSEGGAGRAGLLRCAAVEAVLSADSRVSLPAWLLQLFQVWLFGLVRFNLARRIAEWGKCAHLASESTKAQLRQVLYSWQGCADHCGEMHTCNDPMSLCCFYLL